MRLRIPARWRWFRRQYGIVLCALPVLIAFGILTHRRNETWRHPLNLWRDAAMKSPHKVRPLVNAGMETMRAGDMNSAADFFTRAIREPVANPYQKALQALAKTDLGLAYLQTRQYQESFDLLNEVLMTAPNLEAMNAMALLLLIGGNAAEAVHLTGEILDQGDRAWRIRPSLWATRGQAYQMLGECNEAQAAYVTLKSLMPEFEIPACP